MKRFLFLLAVVSLIVSASAAEVVQAVDCPEPAGAWQVIAGVCIPLDSGLAQTPVATLLETFMNWLLGIVGFLAIIAFVISGIQYLLSAGEDDQITTAKRNMKFSIIGIVVALSGYIVITAVSAFLTGGLGF